MIEVEVAYLAGLVDGEGCFSIWRRNGTTGIELRVSSSDPRVMEWLRARFGGAADRHTPQSSKHKWMWVWRPRVKELDALLPRLIPYLIIKRDQAEIALSFRRLMSAGRGQNVAERERLKEQMHVLNRRGRLE